MGNSSLCFLINSRCVFFHLEISYCESDAMWFQITDSFFVLFWEKLSSFVASNHPVVNASFTILRSNCYIESKTKKTTKNISQLAIIWWTKSGLISRNYTWWLTSNNCGQKLLPYPSITQLTVHATYTVFWLKLNYGRINVSVVPRLLISSWMRKVYNKITWYFINFTLQPCISLDSITALLRLFKYAFYSIRNLLV
jgi:hypothetical protein